jgi:hypothetical protein
VADARVGMGQRILVYEPPPTLECARCAEAYGLTKKVIEDGGSLAPWMARVTP